LRAAIRSGTLILNEEYEKKLNEFIGINDKILKLERYLPISSEI